MVNSLSCIYSINLGAKIALLGWINKLYKAHLLFKKDLTMNKFVNVLAAGLFSLVTSANATLIGTSSGELWDHDVSSNTPNFIGFTGVMFDIALDPVTNFLYGIKGNGYLYLIDQTNGNTTQIGDTDKFINGLTFDQNGVLFASGDNNLYTINVSSAVATLMGSDGYQSSGDIAFDDSGSLYLSSMGTSSDSLWLLDPNTGLGTLLGSTGYNNVYGLNYANNILYGFTESGYTISLSTVDGSGTFLNNNDLFTYGADGVGGVINVNEPTGIILLAILILSLGCFIRLKQKRCKVSVSAISHK